MVIGLIAIAATLGLKFMHLLVGHHTLPLACVVLLGFALVEAIIEMFGKKGWMKFLTIGIVSVAILVVGYFAIYQALGWIPLQ